MIYINIIILIILLVFILTFSIDIKEPYPKIIIDLFHEPYIRFTLYFMVYIIALYDLKIALMYLIILLLLNMDYIYFIKE